MAGGLREYLRPFCPGTCIFPLPIKIKIHRIIITFFVLY